MYITKCNNLRILSCNVGFVIVWYYRPKFFFLITWRKYRYIVYIYIDIDIVWQIFNDYLYVSFFFFFVLFSLSTTVISSVLFITMCITKQIVLGRTKMYNERIKEKKREKQVNKFIILISILYGLLWEFVV